MQDWFDRDLAGEMPLYLMPLAFVGLPDRAEAAVLSKEEKKFLQFLETLEPQHDDPASRYAVTVNVELRFTRSKAKDALAVQVTADPKALPVQLTDEQIRERYPWDYLKLTAECRKRYIGFKVDNTYHSLRKMLK